MSKELIDFVISHLGYYQKNAPRSNHHVSLQHSTHNAAAHFILTNLLLNSNNEARPDEELIHSIKLLREDRLQGQFFSDFLMAEIAFFLFLVEPESTENWKNVFLLHYDDCTKSPALGIDKFQAKCMHQKILAISGDLSRKINS